MGTDTSYYTIGKRLSINSTSPGSGKPWPASFSPTSSSEQYSHYTRIPPSRYNYRGKKFHTQSKTRHPARLPPVTFSVHCHSFRNPHRHTGNPHKRRKHGRGLDLPDQSPPVRGRHSAPCQQHTHNAQLDFGPRNRRGAIRPLSEQEHMCMDGFRTARPSHISRWGAHDQVVGSKISRLYPEHFLRPRNRYPRTYRGSEIDMDPAGHFVETRRVPEQTQTAYFQTGHRITTALQHTVHVTKSRRTSTPRGILLPGHQADSSTVGILAQGSRPQGHHEPGRGAHGPRLAPPPNKRSAGDQPISPPSPPHGFLGPLIPPVGARTPLCAARHSMSRRCGDDSTIFVAAWHLDLLTLEWTVMSEAIPTGNGRIRLIRDAPSREDYAALTAIRQVGIIPPLDTDDEEAEGEENALHSVSRALDGHTLHINLNVRLHRPRRESDGSPKATRRRRPTPGGALRRSREDDDAGPARSRRRYDDAETLRGHGRAAEGRQHDPGSRRHAEAEVGSAEVHGRAEEVDLVHDAASLSFIPESPVRDATEYGENRNAARREYMLEIMQDTLLRTFAAVPTHALDALQNSYNSLMHSVAASWNFLGAAPAAPAGGPAPSTPASLLPPLRRNPLDGSPLSPPRWDAGGRR